MSRGQVDDEFSDAGGRYVREKMAKLNITLRERVRVRQVNAGSVTLEDGSTEAFDVCLWAGAFTVPGLAREAGLHVNERGQVVVDATLRSVSHPDVLAAGDSASAVEHPVAVRMGCVTAMPMGAHAGNNLRALLANEAPKPFNFAYPLRCVALGQKDGIVQFTDEADKIVSRVITGRLGSFVKNVILRYTFMSLVMEGKGWFRFMWMKPKTVVQSQQPITDAV
jgi:NADH:ubiquinone reductase (H+-translocating)